MKNLIETNHYAGGEDVVKSRTRREDISCFVLPHLSFLSIIM